MQGGAPPAAIRTASSTPAASARACSRSWSASRPPSRWTCGWPGSTWPARSPTPGATHLQRAQPITVGHHLMAHATALLRDGERLRHAYAAADRMPLGSGALAGSTLGLPRESVARTLGFRTLTRNTVDAVSDRD